MAEQTSNEQQIQESREDEEQVIHERLKRLDYRIKEGEHADGVKTPVKDTDSGSTSSASTSILSSTSTAASSFNSDAGEELANVNGHSGNDTDRQDSSLGCKTAIVTAVNSASTVYTEDRYPNSPETNKTHKSVLDNVISVDSNSDNEESVDLYSGSMLQDESVVEYDSKVVNSSLCPTVSEKVESKSGCVSKGKEISHSSLMSSNSEMHSSCDLINQIEDLLTTCATSPTEEADVGKIDFSTTSKENLMKIISTLLDECNVLHQEKTKLESDLDRLHADKSSKVYEVQIETLEKSLAQAQADMCSWQSKLQQAEENYMAENIKIRTDLTDRLERMTKQYEAANKDKESMVIKYATSEREVIVARKQKEIIEKKLKEMEKEREQLQNKNKMLVAERARLCQTLDIKVQKNNWFQREVDKLKEEVSSRDVKIKWAQTKLKSEMDVHQETQGKLDRALMKITKHEEELKAIKEEAERVVKDTMESENSRANVLDMQLKEEKARLIMERKVNEDKGSAYHRVNSELEALKKKYTALVEEANSLQAKVKNDEAEKEEAEKLFASLRCELKSSRQQVADLNLQVSNSTHLQQQLQNERDELASANQEVERFQSLNSEIEGDLLACRQKEAELLAFTQKLSDKNVQIQSQFSALQSKAQLMEIEREEMRTELDEVKAQKLKIKNDLTKENQTKSAQVESLHRQLAEKIEEIKQLTTKASDFQNDIQVLKRKHNNTLKDTTREMQKLRRRLEAHEDGSNGGNGSGSGGLLSGRSSQAATPHDSLSQGSRASSNTSLNTLEYQSPNGSHMNSQETLPPLNDPLITQQLLVERIIKLQKAAAKKSEKVEFLEEHITQLVSELKKKSRIIHHYIMKEEAGALATSASDSSKAELMRHGGIMASVYGSAPRDGTMTLDLSLEINRKLQAVLEDTLLKNITLKENLNTLGDEIAKISMQKQQMESQK
ncbi:hypothetical protein SK128_026128 [Halocaridina rubra]|uniref:Coiled-coil domain-containing protein 186 n=1 Tax=Halocaridina rubra TaxID=373956 RepID=A0AAN8WLU2_HALRR